MINLFNKHIKIIKKTYLSVNNKPNKFKQIQFNLYNKFIKQNYICL